MLKKHANLSQISALLISLLLATVFTVGLQKAWADEVTLSGKVTDSEGNPVANASITASGPIKAHGQTAADGSYRITLQPGAYRLEIRPPEGSRLAKKSIEVQITKNMTLDVTLAAGVVLSGKVTTPDGKPVANATVGGKGHRGEHAVFEYDETADDGTYWITMMPGTYSLHVYPPEGSRFLGKHIGELEIIKDMTLDITLDEAGLLLSGKVTAPDGKPVADAYITPFGVGGGGKVRTAADGTYSIVLAPGTYRLEIEPPKESGLPQKTIKDVQVKEDMTLDIKLEGAILSGRVIDSDGNPVANASINASGPSSVSTRTAADGSYRLVLPPGAYRLEIEPPKGSGLLRKNISDLQVTKDMTLDITLESPVILSGKITAPDGNPVANVSISIRGGVMDGWHSSVQSATDGTYRVIIPTGTYKLFLEPPKGSGFPTQEAEARVTKSTKLDITLEAGVILSGKVTALDGKPVAKVYIQAVGWMSDYREDALTVEDGTYQIPLMPDTYCMGILPPEGSDLPRQRRLEAQTISNVKITEDTTLDITLAFSVILSGRVLSPDGKPVAGVGIDARDWLKRQRREGRTSADDTYSIALPPGTYTLMVSPPWNESLRRKEFLIQTITDVKITEDTTLDIKLERGFVLSGRITYPDGKPATDVSISAWAPDASSVYAILFDGSYTIAPLRPGTYWLKISPELEYRFPRRYPRQTITNVKVIEDTILDITLKEGVVLSGRVTAPDGKPVADVTVSASEMATISSGYGETSSDGTYRIRLMPGTYTLRIHPPKDSEFLSQTISDVQVKGDTNLDITLKVGKRFTISGRVTDSKGKGMAGIYVSADNRYGFFTAFTVTAVDGSYQMTLEEGKYDVTCEKRIEDIVSLYTFPGCRISNIEVDKDVTLDITFPPLDEMFEVQGRILDKEGREVRDVYIIAYDETTGNYSRSRPYEGYEGFYRLLLPAGTYNLTLTPPFPKLQMQVSQIPNHRPETDYTLRLVSARF